MNKELFVVTIILCVGGLIYGNVAQASTNTITQCLQDKIKVARQIRLKDRATALVKYRSAIKNTTKSTKQAALKIYSQSLKTISTNYYNIVKSAQIDCKKSQASAAKEPIFLTYSDEYFSFKYPKNTCGTPLAEGLSNKDCSKLWHTEIHSCNNFFDPTDRMNNVDDNGCMLLLAPPFIEGALETAVLQIYLYPQSLYREYLGSNKSAKVTNYSTTSSGYNKKLYEMVVMNSDGSVSAEKRYDGFIDDGRHFVYILISIPTSVAKGTIKYLPYFFNSFKFNPIFSSQTGRCGVKKTSAEKDNCYMAEAYGSYDSAMCDKISDQSMVWVENKINRLGCLFAIGMRRKDPSTCELVKTNAEVYKQCKENMNR